MLYEGYRNQFNDPMVQGASTPPSPPEEGNFARPVLAATLISALMWGLILAGARLLI